MAIVCANCAHLVQLLEGGRLPPWCPYCGDDLKRGVERRAAATNDALAATQTTSASEIAAGLRRRGAAPAPAPQPSAAVVATMHAPESSRTEEPAVSAGESRYPEETAEAPPIVRPGARVYIHRECGGRTEISGDDFAALDDPSTWVAQTFCARCQKFVSVEMVVWEDTGETVAANRQRHRAARPFWRRLLQMLFG